MQSDQARLSERMDRLSASALRTIFEAISQPGMISFAGGLPAADSFPKLSLGELSEELLQYGASAGEWSLREQVARRLTAEGLPTVAERVLILSGSQQGIDLVAKMVVDKHVNVAIENPTYLAALQVFSFFGANYQCYVPGQCRALIGKDVNLLYTNPTFQNPTSMVYSAAQRQDVADYCDSAQAVLFEDDPYRDLVYESCCRTPICSLVQSTSWVYQSSFSKTLAPGLRLGYLTCSEDLYLPLLHLKQAADLHSNRLSQSWVVSLLNDPDYLPRHQRQLQRYISRRDHFHNVLMKHFSDLADWQLPAGGLFFWLQLKPDIDVDLQQLLNDCLQQGVAFLPGASFVPPGQHDAGSTSAQRSMRLNFSNAETQQVEEGLALLARLLRMTMRSQAGYIRKAGCCDNVEERY